MPTTDQRPAAFTVPAELERYYVEPSGAMIATWLNHHQLDVDQYEAARDHLRKAALARAAGTAQSARRAQALAVAERCTVGGCTARGVDLTTDIGGAHRQTVRLCPSHREAVEQLARQRRIEPLLDAAGEWLDQRTADVMDSPAEVNAP